MPRKKPASAAPAFRRTVMAIAAHPDDIEFTMAGTLCLLRDAGWEVHYMNISNGDIGSATMTRAETARVRLREARAACKLAGFHHHKPIAADMGIRYVPEQVARVTSAIRAARPSVILTHSPHDYHEDHENACRVAAAAAFVKGMKNADCLPKREPYFDDVVVYHAMPHGLRDGMGKLQRSELWVNIAPAIDLKKAMLACHTSQKEWLDVTQGMDSYLETAVEICSAMGKMSGKYRLAEGWRRHNPLGFAANLEWDPLRDALKKHCVADKKYQAWLNA